MANRIKNKGTGAFVLTTARANHLLLVLGAQIYKNMAWNKNKSNGGKNFLESDIFYRNVSWKVMVLPPLSLLHTVQWYNCIHVQSTFLMPCFHFSGPLEKRQCNKFVCVIFISGMALSRPTIFTCHAIMLFCSRRNGFNDILYFIIWDCTVNIFLKITISVSLPF